MVSLHQLLGRVRRRMRLQAALDWGARAALLAAASFTLWIYFYELHLLPRSVFFGLCALSLAAVAITALVAALRSIPLARVAKRVDSTHALHDRLGSALVFAAEAEPTPFMECAIADAVAVASRADVRRAAPLVRPRGLGATLLVLLIAFGVALLHYPAEAVAPPVVPVPLPRLTVDPELLAPEREAAAELEREVDKLDDPALQALAKEMHKLVEQLDNQELTRKQVFDKLAEIENKLAPMEGNAEELKRALKKAGAEMGKEKVTKAMADALVKEDLQQAKKELEKLASAAEERAKDQPEKKQLDEKEREALARSLERAAKAQQEKTQEEKKREAEEQKLKEEERKLKRELEKNPDNQEAQRQLKRNQRELERLEREKKQRAEQKRQLERLQREMQKAAEQLRQKLSPEAAEQLRKMAQQMGQMENEIKKLGSGQSMRLALGELKELLRRSGSGQGNPQSGDGQQQGQDGQPRAGDGQGQGKGDGKSKLRDFSQRAGQGGEKMLILGDKGNGDTSVILPLPMGPGPGQGGPGDKPGEAGQGPGNELPGDGVGDQHDPNMKGDPSRIAAKLKDTRVTGKQGAGPSKSETILGSAEKGFASRGYRRVYGDYSSVLEEVMSQERVPPGYRYFIKRYFQLIKPRD